MTRLYNDYPLGYIIEYIVFFEKRLNNTNGIIKDMNQVFSVVVHKEKKYYVAECPEVGTVSQGETIEVAIKNLKEATELYLAEFPSQRRSRPFVSFFEVTVHGKTPKTVRA